MNYIFPYIGNVIIPTDEVIFFRGVGQPPTSSYSLIVTILVGFHVGHPMKSYPTKSQRNARSRGPELAGHLRLVVHALRQSLPSRRTIRTIHQWPAT